MNFCKTNTLMVCINQLFCASILLSSDKMDRQFTICTWRDLPIDFTRFCQYRRHAHMLWKALQCSTPSRMYPCCHFWNGSNIGLTDVEAACFQGRLRAAASFSISQLVVVIQAPQVGDQVSEIPPEMLDWFVIGQCQTDLSLVAANAALTPTVWWSWRSWCTRESSVESLWTKCPRPSSRPSMQRTSPLWKTGMSTALTILPSLCDSHP